MHLKIILTIHGKNIPNIDGVLKHIVEQNICVQWGGLTGVWIKIHSEEFHTLYSSVRNNGYQMPEDELYYVKLKDRKRSLSEKKKTTRRCGIRETATTRNVEIEKRPQREILRCGSYSEDSEGFGLKVTCNLRARRWPNLT